MLLHLVDIRNFRGIASLRVGFGEITVAIGENDSGKTSLLDAIRLCLAPHDGGEVVFSADDFHIRDGLAPGPISITLTFRETADDRWEEPPHSLLRGAITHAKDGSRRVCVELRADFDAERAVPATVVFVDRTGAAINPQPPSETWRTLRSLAPVIALKADRFYHTDDAWEPFATEGDGRAARSSDGPRGVCVVPVPADPRIRRPADGRGNARRTLCRADAAGANAAGRARGPAAHCLAGGARAVEPAAGAALDRAGRAPERGAQVAAVFVVVDAVLRARGPDAIAPRASPIVIIEEPEAHLHPIVASFVWSTLESLPAQKIITTYSGEVIAAAPPHALRRIVRSGETTTSRRLGKETLNLDELRRIAYHVRTKRGASLFARCWLLIEGETEAWLVPELASLCGYSFAGEGVWCLEFAQCGVEPLVKLADDLGIAWHLLADGDNAGSSYALTATELLRGRDAHRHITHLTEPDVEELMWNSGYAGVYRRATAGPHAAAGAARARRREQRRWVIERAIKSSSKPMLALEVAEAIAAIGPRGVPPVLRGMIDTVIGLARGTGIMRS